MFLAKLRSFIANFLQIFQKLLRFLNKSFTNDAATPTHAFSQLLDHTIFQETAVKTCDFFEIIADLLTNLLLSAAETGFCCSFFKENALQILLKCAIFLKNCDFLCENSAFWPFIARTLTHERKNLKNVAWNLLFFAVSREILEKNPVFFEKALETLTNSRENPEILAFSAGILHKVADFVIKTGDSSNFSAVSLRKSFSNAGLLRKFVNFTVFRHVFVCKRGIFSVSFSISREFFGFSC